MSHCVMINPLFDHEPFLLHFWDQNNGKIKITATDKNDIDGMTTGITYIDRVDLSAHGVPAYYIVSHTTILNIAHSHTNEYAVIPNDDDLSSFVSSILVKYNENIKSIETLA